MSRLIGMGAVSLLLHCGLALVLIALTRAGSLTSPPGLSIVLAVFDEERGVSNGAAGGGRPHAAGERGPALARRLLSSPGSGVVSAAAAPRTESDRVREMIGSELQRLESVSVPGDPEPQRDGQHPESAPAADTPGRSATVSPVLEVDVNQVPGAPGTQSGSGLRGAGQGADAGARGRGAGASVPALGTDSVATPRYSDNPRPAYPWRARARGEQGLVLLSVLVNEQGGVSDVRVTSSSGSPILDKAAQGAVKEWRFHPGRRGSQAVPSWVQVPIRFRLED